MGDDRVENSKLWVKLSRICYANILIQASPHDSQIWFWNPWFAFTLSITYTYWTLVDARVKKDEIYKIKNVT